MATLHIKKLPDELYARLRRRASAHDQTVAQEVIQILIDTPRQPAKGGEARH